MKQIELDTLKQAILNEIEGYEFYQLAAGKAYTEEAKQAFLNLAEEEMKHVEWLQDLFIKMRSDSQDTYNLAMVADPPSPQLYNWEKLDRRDAQSAMSVFSIGMQLEKSAVQFYEEASSRSSDPVVKELYKKLVAWEQVHYDQFAREHDILKSEFWDAQGFAPF